MQKVFNMELGHSFVLEMSQNFYFSFNIVKITDLLIISMLISP